MTLLELEVSKAGFQQGFKVPYASISKVSHTLLNLDTCLNRLETQIFNINLYDDNFNRLIRNTDKVEDDYDFSTLNVANRKVNRVQFQNRFVDEPKKGFYFSSLTYEVITQKVFSPSNVKLDATGGDNFYEALYTRYKQFPELNGPVENFIVTGFGDEEWPFNFLYIPNYSTVQAFLTTCSRLEETSFSISIQHKNPDHIERVIELVDDIYSYCTLKLSGKRFTSLQWRANSLIELEPEFWQGTIDYSLILEKDIT